MHNRFASESRIEARGQAEGTRKDNRQGRQGKKGTVGRRKQAGQPGKGDMVK